MKRQENEQPKSGKWICCPETNLNTNWCHLNKYSAIELQARSIRTIEC